MYTSAVFDRAVVEYVGTAKLTDNRERPWLVSLNLDGQHVRTLGTFRTLEEGWSHVKHVLQIEDKDVELPRTVGESTDGPFGVEENQ